MKLIVENWQNYIEEGIEDGEHNFKYYAFDWDDNIVEMPTKIILLDKSGDEVGMGTEDFAHYRGMIGKEEFDYEGVVVKDFAPNPFRNFRVTGDGQFLKDIRSAEPAPSWNDFVECINSASIFAIITARGHKPSTLKRAVYKYIISNHDGINSGEVKRNIQKYNKLFNKTNKDSSIQGYLDLCKFYPVSFGPMASMASPEQAKVQALGEFIDYCQKINKYMPIKVGFSDDDRKNIDLIEKHFGEPRELVSMTIKYTGKQHGEKK